MNLADKQALKTRLQDHISPERAEKIYNTSQLRTNYIQVAIEDIQRDRNAGALIRTCDCFGVQQVSVIEQKYNAKVANSISKGSDKWMHIRKFDLPNENNTKRCITTIQEEGFQVIAMTPHNADIELTEFEITKPTCFLFGTEMEGLTPQALELADLKMRIPIYGFTESFNISVSAALTLQHSVSKLHKSNLPWRLSSTEQLDLEIEWILASLGKSGPGIMEAILKEFSS